MRRVLKWGGLGCLGFIALSVVLGVVGAALAPPPDTGTGTSNPGAQGEKQPKPQTPDPKPEPPPKPEGPEDYLNVTGTKGIPFSCSVMDGDMDQRTVDGTVPQKIALKEMGWGATSENSCQKSGAKGVLTVTIVDGGDVQDQNSTSAAYGIASVGYPN